LLIAGAGEFTVCAQLKILTTATFSVIILGTQLTETKWRALALLVLGCILVAIPGLQTGDSEKGAGMSSDMLIGYGAVLLEVALSGFASIYFEKVVQ
jgi:solute carrier family 35 (UDP-sugar transporter), member A1/2/3